MFRKSSLQIKWDSFRFKERRGERERKSCKVLFNGKILLLRWGQAADLTPVADWEPPVPVLHCLMP